jgi:hypothetical protein
MGRTPGRLAANGFIPVLVGDASMPRKQDLPETLAPLSRRNAIELSETRFHADVDRLIEAIEKPRTLREKKVERFAGAVAPAGNHRAVYRDRNIWIGDSTGASAVQITTEGSVQSRIKFGTASWVYGEELGQRTAMWWSPDGKKLAYYRFDESKVPDYYITPALTQIHDTTGFESPGFGYASTSRPGRARG